MNITGIVIIFIMLMLLTFLMLNNKSIDIPYERFYNNCYLDNYFPKELINDYDAKEYNEKKKKEILDDEVKYPHYFTHQYYGQKK